MLPSKNKGAGGKLNRSEIIQARLNPKAKYAVELMARLERRTVSSIFEGLLEEAINTYPVEAILQDKAQVASLLLGERTPQNTSLKKVLDKLWSPDEIERFVGFAISFPDLLTPDEEKLWRLILEIPYFWEHYEIQIEDEQGQVIDKGWWPVSSQRGLIRQHLREHWTLLHDIASGKQSEKALEKIDVLHTIGKAVQKPAYMPVIKKRIPPHDHKI